MPKISTIVVGGGGSGSLLASALMRSSNDAHVAVIEPRELLGTGMAYSTDCPVHLLNVPAAKMSAFPQDPSHFVRWLDAEHHLTFSPDSFAPRAIYGEYLHAIAAQAQIIAGGRFAHVRCSARDAQLTRSGVRVTCTDGSVLEGTSLVVACGNSLPAPWPGMPRGIRMRGYFASAWENGALIPDDPDETVLLLGTGLTAVDAVLGLRFNGHTGRIYMVSRRGLLPHEHRVFDAPQTGGAENEPAGDLLDVARELTRSARSEPQSWRTKLDLVRPKTNALWQALTISDQRRFLRHVLPYWNVHRHRMAPEIVRAIAEMMSTNLLRMLAGRTGHIVADGADLLVPVHLRGSEETLTVRAHRVVNCSGPVNDFRKLDNPFVRSLLSQGLMSPNDLNIGVRVAASGALIDASGKASERVFSIGPVRFGTLIETTAIPEIRVQAAELAELIAGEFAAA